MIKICCFKLDFGGVFDDSIKIALQILTNSERLVFMKKLIIFFSVLINIILQALSCL